MSRKFQDGEKVLINHTEAIIYCLYSETIIYCTHNNTRVAPSQIEPFRREYRYVVQYTNVHNNITQYAIYHELDLISTKPIQLCEIKDLC